MGHSRAARIIASNHTARLWTTTKTPELIPSSGYLITVDFCPADFCFVEAVALRAPACHRFLTISLIPEVGIYKEAKHILSTTPRGQILDQKCLYAPIIPLSVPGLGVGGFN